MNINIGKNDARRFGEEALDKGWVIFSNEAVRANDRDAMAHIAQMFGKPSSRDNGPLWPIIRRSDTGTFSETSGEAKFHTDAQYRAEPEPLFLLFCVRPAACGGGRNRMLPLYEIRDTIHHLPSSDLRELQRPAWSWRVPDIFASSAHDRAVDMPVLGSEHIRWRHDNLMPLGPDQAATAGRFDQFLNSHPGVTEASLAAGEILLVHNRGAVHARTQFSDPDRLLYRTRLW